MHVAERGADLVECLLLQLCLCLHLLAVRICPRRQIAQSQHFPCTIISLQQALLCM